MLKKQAQRSENMYRGKRKFNAVLVLMCAAVGAALVLSGCPDTVPSGGGEDPNPPDPGTTVTTDFEITLDGHVGGGTVTLSDEDGPLTSWTSVKSGTVITVTLTPKTGFELDPNSFAVYRGRYVPVTHTPSGFSYTYTFTMPADLVRINVDFVSVLNAIKNLSDMMTIYNSWEEIAALSAMIKNAQTLGIADTGAVMENAITKLAGTAAGTGGTPAAAPGIIENKMRSEDLDKWISLRYPSYKIDKGVNIRSGVNITHLYYVKEDNPAPLPSLDLTKGKGWEGSEKTAANTTYADAALEVEEIKLTFNVGNNPQNMGSTTFPALPISYSILLWPCAQYTIEYVSGATGGSVTIQDFYTNPSDPWSASTSVPTSIPPTSTTRQYGGTQTLNNTTETSNKKTGDVGKAIGTTASAREIYTSIQVDSANIYVSFLDSNGDYVLNWDGSASLKDLTSTNTGSNSLKYFYPKSQKYTIRVTSTTPPTAGLPPQ